MIFIISLVQAAELLERRGQLVLDNPLVQLCNSYSTKDMSPLVYLDFSAAIVRHRIFNVLCRNFLNFEDEVETRNEVDKLFQALYVDEKTRDEIFNAMDKLFRDIKAETSLLKREVVYHETMSRIASYTFDVLQSKSSFRLDNLGITNFERMFSALQDFPERFNRELFAIPDSPYFSKEKKESHLNLNSKSSVCHSVQELVFSDERNVESLLKILHTKGLSLGKVSIAFSYDVAGSLQTSTYREIFQRRFIDLNQTIPPCSLPQMSVSACLRARFGYQSYDFHFDAEENQSQLLLLKVYQSIGRRTGLKSEPPFGSEITGLRQGTVEAQEGIPSEPFIQKIGNDWLAAYDVMSSLTHSSPDLFEIIIPSAFPLYTEPDQESRDIREICSLMKDIFHYDDEKRNSWKAMKQMSPKVLRLPVSVKMPRNFEENIFNSTDTSKEAAQSCSLDFVVHELVKKGIATDYQLLFLEKNDMTSYTYAVFLKTSLIERFLPVQYWYPLQYSGWREWPTLEFWLEGYLCQFRRLEITDFDLDFHSKTPRWFDIVDQIEEIGSSYLLHTKKRGRCFGTDHSTEANEKKQTRRVCECFPPYRGRFCELKDESRRKNQPKAAIHVLVGRNSVDELCSVLLPSLWTNYNQVYDYPLIVFHDGLTTRERKKIISTNGNRTRLWFAYVENFKKQRKRRFLEDEDAYNEGYRSMCRFRSLTLFEQPVVLQFDYLFTLDSDSYFPAKLEFDPISAVVDSGASYAFNHWSRDQPSSVQHLWEYLRLYFEFKGYETQNTSLLKKISHPWLKDTFWNDYNRFLFMNDIEILKVSWFRNSEYSEFVNYLDSVDGFYRFRWGDHAVRTLALSAWMPESEIVELKMPYAHQSVCMCQLETEVCLRTKKNLWKCYSEKELRDLRLTPEYMDYVEAKNLKMCGTDENVPDCFAEIGGVSLPE